MFYENDTSFKVSVKHVSWFSVWLRVQGSGAGGQTQNPRGHCAGLQGEVPADVWQEGDQQEIPAVLWRGMFCGVEYTDLVQVTKLEQSALY